MHAKNKEKTTAKMLRLLYFQLVVPIKRARDNPEIIARGVFIGLLLGMTPTVGAQMYLIFMVWIALRGFWNFNVVLAIAWSYFSNPLTMIPLYYMFYLTGKLVLFDFGDHSSFDLFSEQLEKALSGDEENFLYAIWELLKNIWNAFGWSIVIGCLPYSLGLSVLGYWGTMKFIGKPKDDNGATTANQ